MAEVPDDLDSDEFAGELLRSLAHVLEELANGRKVTFAVAGIPIVTLTPREEDDGTVRQPVEEYLAALCAAAYSGASRYRPYMAPLSG